MNEHEKILRPSLAGLTPYNSGLSISDIQSKYSVTNIAKLGSNENPYGPTPKVLDILANNKDVHLYPESNVNSLRKELSANLNISPENLIFGNGSEELLSIICRSVIEKNDRVITLFPSFPLHEDYVRMMGGVIERITVTDDLQIDIPALKDAVKKPAKMLIFANPMNPVGSSLNPLQLREVIEATHPDTLLVLDEAYFEYAIKGDYCSGMKVLEKNVGNWIVLRTFSKAWGLAGLRIGFGICSSSWLCSALDLTRTPFNINSIAQKAALMALHDEPHMRRHVDKTLKERSIVESRLRRLGYKVAPSLGNFLFFDVCKSSSEVAERLISNGTIVKPWKQKGFDNYIRVSIGKQIENEKFFNDLKLST